MNHLDWDYAPAPESAAIGRLQDRYQLYIGGRFVDGRGDDVKSINPATEEALASVSTASTADVDDAVAAARTAYEQVWSQISPAERGKYLYRIARGIAERARELAVVETLDNGKPIKESRDVDVPTAAAHFFYHAGWADKLQHAGFGSAPAALGVAGQVIPWNFPLLMAAWKIAPALAAGNTVVIKPAETTPLSILVLAEIIADADLPPGVVNIITGAGDIGAALVNHPGHRQGRLHRVHRGRQADPVVAGRHRSEDHPGTGREGRQHHLRRRADRPGRRGHRQRDLLQPGSRLLRRIPPAGAGIGRGRGQRETAGADRHAATRRSDGQEHRHRRDQLGDPVGHHPRAHRDRRGGRRGALDVTVSGARPRLLLRSDSLHPGRAVHADCQGGDLRAGALGADLPHPRRGGGQGEQHPVWPVRWGVDRKGFPHPGDGLGAAGRGGLGQHLQPVRSDRGLRWVQGVRFRPGGRAVRVGCLPEHR